MKVGAKVANFEAPATGGETFRLKDAAGKKLVIYFYPKDMSSRCTQESRSSRDPYPARNNAGVRIVGVPRHSLASHEKFKAKQTRPYEPLAEAGEKICQLFDVILEKSMSGRNFSQVVRSSWRRVAAGVLRREWHKVKVPAHAEEALEAAQSL
jgi:thioredoxin-dependent peroxiredoxin